MAAGIRILRRWRDAVDPVLPERGPAARLLAGVLGVALGSAVLGIASYGLLNPCP
jgi:hypothetical protein